MGTAVYERYLYYYDDQHFRSTSDSQGHVDLSGVVAVEGIASPNKKDKARFIQLSTKVRHF